MSPAKDALRGAVRTFIPAFLVLFVPGLLGWLNDITSWARDEGATPFPDARGLAYLLVSATVAGLIAAGTFVLRIVENYTGHSILRNDVVPPPQRPPRGEGGYTHGNVVLGLVALVVVIVALVLIL